MILLNYLIFVISQEKQEAKTSRNLTAIPKIFLNLHNFHTLAQVTIINLIEIIQTN